MDGTITITTTPSVCAEPDGCSYGTPVVTTRSCTLPDTTDTVCGETTTQITGECLDTDLDDACNTTGIQEITITGYLCDESGGCTPSQTLSTQTCLLDSTV